MALARQQLFDAAALHQALAQPGADVGALFRERLQHGRRQLQTAYHQGAPARELVALHAWLADQVLLSAWRQAGSAAPHDVGRHALIAVGGYGRRALHPYSDIDIMLLVDKQDRARTEQRGARFIRFLWDLGLEVGHSVRDLEECVAQARADLATATALMEARWLAGDLTLFNAMLQATAPPAVWPVADFFTAKLTEQERRHQRFEDTAYNLEPNLKEGPGGLRDIQTIGWVAQRHFTSHTLKDLIGHHFLSEEEFRSLIRGRNFIWRLRFGLHYLAGRHEDRLLFDYQRELAEQFGYRSRNGHLAVEQLMKRYYRTIKDLRILNEILLQHFQEAILRQPAPTVAVNERFQAVDGFLEVRSASVFKRKPWALLELCLLLQQDKTLRGVRASTIRLVRANLHRIDDQLRRSRIAQRLFIQIFREPAGLTRTLRRMNAYGVLGAYLPAFGRIVGQMQHDLFHVYTVDAHALMVVRNLRRFAEPRFREELPAANAIMDLLARKDRLYLAGLFHDIAKGRGGDHSELGERDAYAFCHAHGLSEYDAHFVAWLVRHHLLMSWIAQREDISDPAVVARFATQIGDQEHLDNLYLLTMADIRGTSPRVWNAWKAQLLAELYAATSRALRIGVGQPLDLAARIDDIKRETATQLADSKLDADTLREFWNQFGTDYPLRHDAENLAWHALTLGQARLLDLPLVRARNNVRIGSAQFLVVAPDSESLLSRVAGGFDRLNLSIAHARTYTLHSGLALLAFVVLDAHGQTPAAGDITEYEARLRRHLLDPKPTRATRRPGLSRRLRHFPIKTAIRFSDAAHGQYTVMELVAQDRPGLLHKVALAFLHCKVRLVTAKIATFGERAEDVFFIADRDREPIADAAQLACIEGQVGALLDHEDSAPGSH